MYRWQLLARPFHHPWKMIGSQVHWIIQNYRHQAQADHEKPHQWLRYVPIANQKQMFLPSIRILMAFLFLFMHLLAGRWSRTTSTTGNKSCCTSNTKSAWTRCTTRSTRRSITTTINSSVSFNPLPLFPLNKSCKSLSKSWFSLHFISLLSSIILRSCKHYCTFPLWFHNFILELNFHPPSDRFHVLFFCCCSLVRLKTFFICLFISVWWGKSTFRCVFQ